jgi:uncharacterized cupredoxin-like copper-binding protein
MSRTLTPGTPPAAENGAARAPDSPPPPTDQQQFDAAVQRDGKIFLQVLGAAAIFAALVMSIVALLVATDKSNTKSSTPAASPSPAPAHARAPVAAAPASSVAVNLVDYKVLPNASVGAAGRITFHVRNSGQTTHEFVVLRTRHLAASLPLKAGRADESGNVGETGELAVGASKTVSFKLPPGHYALVCNLPGHYNAGQHTDFTVR